VFRSRKIDPVFPFFQYRLLFSTAVPIQSCAGGERRIVEERESVLFIGTQFSNLYTAVDTPAMGRVVVCLGFVCLVFVCKYVLGHSRVSQPLNLRLCLLLHLGCLTSSYDPRPAADAVLTHTGSSADLPPALLPFHGPISFTFLPRPDLHYIHLQ
jgi:hypothetical protein